MVGINHNPGLWLLRLAHEGGRRRFSHLIKMLELDRRSGGHWVSNSGLRRWHGICGGGGWEYAAPWRRCMRGPNPKGNLPNRKCYLCPDLKVWCRFRTWVTHLVQDMGNTFPSP